MATQKRTTKGTKKAAQSKSPQPPVPSPSLEHIAEDLRTLAVEIKDLVLDPHNARKHNAANIKSIAACLKEFGQLKPIVVHAETHVIEAGNGTLLAAQKLGWTHLAAVRVRHDRAAATGFALADNRTAELAVWDDDILAGLLLEIEDQQPDLYADLLLDELRREDPNEPAGGEGTGVPDSYQIVVECVDQADQKRLFERFEKEGRACRLLTT